MPNKKENVVHKKDERIDIVSSIELDTTEKSLGYGEVQVLVSNSGTDRHGESILVEGIDLTQVKRNPVVLWAHDYGGLPIGSITKIWKSAGNLIANVKFATDVYDFANTIYKMVLGGFINAVSIGGLVKNWNEDYTVIKELEMVEVSFVPVGAHPDALVLAKSLEITPEVINEQFEDFILRSLLDKRKGIGEDVIENSIQSLKHLVSALEKTYKDKSTETDNINSKKNNIKKLVLARSTARSCDKVSELIIAAITKQLN